MWGSVRDALAILVGGNLGEVGFILASTAITGVSPLGARQMLLVNLLTDMLPAMTIALRSPRRRSPKELLHEGPEASLGGPLAYQIALRAANDSGWGNSRLARGAADRNLEACEHSRTGRPCRDTAWADGSHRGRKSCCAGLHGRFRSCTRWSRSDTRSEPLLRLHADGASRLGIAVGSSAVATGASVAAPWAVTHLVPLPPPLNGLGATGRLSYARGIISVQASPRSRAARSRTRQDRSGNSNVAWMTAGLRRSQLARTVLRMEGERGPVRLDASWRCRMWATWYLFESDQPMRLRTIGKARPRDASGASHCGWLNTRCRQGWGGPSPR